MSALDLPKPTEKSIAVSPAKGILLTPGTVTTRRKTVSFGADENKAPSEAGKAAEQEGGDGGEEEKKASTVVTSNESKPIRRTLFNRPRPLRETIAAQEASKKETDTRAVEQQPQPLPSQDPSAGAADVTLDLQQPRSASGQHWMKEYQREHDVSKAEMKKLIRYSQNAKSHASKRDREATRMRDKLDKSEARVHELEAEVAALKTQQDLRAPPDPQPASLSTALPQPPAVPSAAAASSTSQASPHDTELAQLRRAAAEAEARAEAAARENDGFRRTILRVKEEMARYEARHLSWVEARRRKDERHAAQRAALKAKVVAYRERLQAEFDEYRDGAESRNAHLQREVERLGRLLGEGGTGQAGHGEDGKQSGDGLRKLPAKAQHDREQGREEEEPSPARKTPAKAAAVRRLRDEDADPASSPTILESHIQRASRQEPAGGAEEIEDYFGIGAEEAVASIMKRDRPRPPSPRPSLIPYSLGRSLREQGPEGGDAGDGELPVVVKRGARDAVGPPRPRREIRVRSRHGLTAGRLATAADVPPARTVLTPEREAAARARIALRSAEKERSKEFLFGEDKRRERDKRAVGVLSARAINRL